MPAQRHVSAVVIGGGFYGCALALHLRKAGFTRILLAEQELELLGRASFANQARVHNGYHYPRSFVTAGRSHANFQRFCADYRQAVRSDFTMLYAIARKRSNVTPQQFERFARDIGAPLRPAPRELTRLFAPSLIAQVYVADECAFDAVQLRRIFQEQLSSAGIEVALGAPVVSIRCDADGPIVRLGGTREGMEVSAQLVLNCTYAGIDNIVGRGHGHVGLKYEVAEIALVEPPREIVGLGITVMDGPFFSIMPFPARSCYSLSHVRYTPQVHYFGQDGCSWTQREPPLSSRANFMIADAARYMPCVVRSRYRESLFEAKVLLARNERDDGRPVLMRPEPELPGVVSILGGKLDNIYDVVERLDVFLAPLHLPGLAR